MRCPPHDGHNVAKGVEDGELGRSHDEEARHDREQQSDAEADTKAVHTLRRKRQDPT